MAKKKEKKVPVRRAKGTRHEFVFPNEIEAQLREVMAAHGESAAEVVRRGIGVLHTCALTGGTPKWLDMVERMGTVRRLGEQLVAVASQESPADVDAAGAAQADA